MMLHLSQIGQIGRPVSDIDRSEAFHEKGVGLKKLFRFGDLAFFDCAGRTSSPEWATTISGWPSSTIPMATSWR